MDSLVGDDCSDEEDESMSDASSMEEKCTQQSIDTVILQPECSRAPTILNVSSEEVIGFSISCLFVVYHCT